MTSKSFSADKTATPNQFTPTADQVRFAHHVPIEGCDPDRRWHDDKIFALLQHEASEAIGSYKIADKRRWFRRLCHAARRASYRDDVIFVPLHLSRLSEANRRVLDAAESAGWLIKFPGGSWCGNYRLATCYYVVPVFRAWPYRKTRRRGLIEVKSRRRKVKQGRKTVRMKSKKLKYDTKHPVAVETKRQLAVVNDVNWEHSYTSRRWNIFTKSFDADRIKDYNPWLTAKFLDNFDLGGRLYTSGIDGYQTARKVERRTLCIDGEPCSELDYQCMGPRLCYHLIGLPFTDDAYNFLGPGKAARHLAKRALNILLNASSEREALGSLRMGVARWKHRPGTSAFNKAHALHRDWDRMGKPDVRELLKSAWDHHKPIREFFYADANVSLMRHDSDIALRVMHKLAEQGIPAACFHDSFVVQHQHIGELYNVMDLVYAAKLGFRPVIELTRGLDVPAVSWVDCPRAA